MRCMFFAPFDQERERIKNYRERTKKVSVFSWCFSSLRLCFGATTGDGF